MSQKGTTKRIEKILGFGFYYLLNKNLPEFQEIFNVLSIFPINHIELLPEMT